VLPGDIDAIAVDGPGGAWSAVRSGERWRDGGGRDIDAYIIARLVRVLGEPPAGGDAVVAARLGRVRLTTRSGEMVIEVGSPDAVGRAGIAVDGRAAGWIPAASLGDLLPGGPGR
jgi:hypothetical protein